jgi:hypothetical protein
MHHDRYITPQSRALRFLSRTGVRVVTTLIVCALPVIPVVLLVYNNVDSAGFQPLGYPAVDLAQPRDNNYGVPTEVYSSNADGTLADVCVTFEFLGLDPSVPDVSLGVLVGVTGAGKTELENLSKQGYKNVSVVVKSNSGLSNFEIPVAVSVLAAARLTRCDARLSQKNLDQHAVYRSTRTLTLLGQPRAFPQDWYELNDQVGVIAGHSQNGTALPSSIVMMSRDEDLRVGVQADQPSYSYTGYPNQPAEHQVFFTVNRPTWIITYTYFVAAMPFLLLITLLWFKRFAQRKALEPSDAAFGLAAAMVAILPLRQVLVPTTIPGLTRLDLLFGLGICFLVMASILWVVVWLPLLPYRRPRQHPAGEGVDGQGVGTGGPGEGVTGVTQDPST